MLPSLRALHGIMLTTHRLMNSSSFPMNFYHFSLQFPSIFCITYSPPNIANSNECLHSSSVHKLSLNEPLNSIGSAWLLIYLIACSPSRIVQSEAHGTFTKKVPFNNSVLWCMEKNLHKYFSCDDYGTIVHKKIQVSDKKLKEMWERGKRKQKGDVTHILLRHHHYASNRSVMGEVIYVL